MKRIVIIYSCGNKIVVARLDHIEPGIAGGQRNQLHIRIVDILKYPPVVRRGLLVDQHQPREILAALIHDGRKRESCKQSQPVLYPLLSGYANPRIGVINASIEAGSNIVPEPSHC